MSRRVVLVKTARKESRWRTKEKKDDSGGSRGVEKSRQAELKKKKFPKWWKGKTTCKKIQCSRLNPPAWVRKKSQSKRSVVREATEKKNA